MTGHADVGDPRLYRDDSWRPHFARLRGRPARVLGSITGQEDAGDPGLPRDDGGRPLSARLRAEDPPPPHAESPYGPYWSVTRHADILKVELDPVTYSSASAWGGI